ncbi:hypothetical protein [Flavilitoribacter nigricans]|uniref:Uncharacterized protein n=1 Tax=Flavilitoribacter nigricans (strain ATCC 23147 / DSM 23189 / NBRC 102662 / NCIMB 1420 / SS-2) TaxID=1122177 RepID=A0A2D0MYQ6_FLAN2|nr:hypothetical protein [Flavilitoribacter nigricans]PHN01268.1 hypothetical protein CRP01_37960 [Flavilitoribacter nigricans DSM 23189 = NBRC 102662]
MKIERIHISSEGTGEYGPIEAFISDVVVVFDDQVKYAASFLSYGKIKMLIRENRLAGKCLSGKYFWMKNMVLIDRCKREDIELVIQDLLDEGDFKAVFRKL